MSLPTIARWYADVALAAVVAIAIDLRISIAAEPDAAPPGMLDYTTGVVFALALPWRRRWPRGVLVYSIIVLIIHNAVLGTGISPIVPLAVPLYAAARAGHLWWAVASGVAFECVALGFIVIDDDTPMRIALNGLLLEVALLAVVTLLGEARRSRSTLAAKAADDARRAILDHERETRLIIDDERIRIARELHDVLAHTIAGAAVQAAVAADHLAAEPAESHSALEAVRRSCREARLELAAILDVLRSGTDAEGPREPAPGLDRMDALLNSARCTGLAIKLTVEGRRRALPPVVDLTAYRVLQESLTNVMKHANADNVAVTVTYASSGIALSVSDDGRCHTDRSSASTGHGYGAIGMRERVAAVGGSIVIGSRPEGGFSVVATLPAAAESEPSQ